MRLLPAVTALVTVLAATIVHGFLTDRWSADAARQRASVDSSTIPLVIAEWRGVSTDADPTLALTGSDYVAGRYTNEQTGDVVMMTLVWGRPGPVTVHTPLICYPGSGLQLLAPPVKQSVRRGDSNAEDEFWIADFRGDAPGMPTHRVLWAWKAEKGWRAVDHPRLAFARQSLVFKLYVVRTSVVGSELPDREPCVEFVRRFGPEFDRWLSGF